MSFEREAIISRLGVLADKCKNNSEAYIYRAAIKEINEYFNKNAHLQAKNEMLKGQADGYCAEYTKQKAENERLKEEIKKAVKFIDETPRYHDARDTVIDAIKYNLTKALQEEP